MGPLGRAGRGAFAARTLIVLAALGAFLGAVAYAAGGPHAGHPASPGGERSLSRLVKINGRGWAAARLPRVRITAHPQATSTSSTARFAFLARGAGRRFECRLDAGRWAPCVAPAVYRILSVGAHVFSVRVKSGRRHGRASAYWWTLLEPKPFSIEPRLTTLPDLFPGAGTVQLPVTISNPNPVPILVTAVRVALTADPPGCDGADNLEVLPSNVSDAMPVLVPAGGKVDLPSGMASAPAIGLRELPVNQDACQGAELPLLFTGEAHG
jgi:hypothetical protein